MTLCAAEGCPSFSTRVTSINAAAAAPVTETLRPPVDPALAFFSQELQQLHLPLLGDTLQLHGEGQSLGSVEEGVAPPGNTNWLRYLL